VALLDGLEVAARAYAGLGNEARAEELREHAVAIQQELRLWY
jgi:hypothetical protein